MGGFSILPLETNKLIRTIKVVKSRTCVSGYGKHISASQRKSQHRSQKFFLNRFEIFYKMCVVSLLMNLTCVLYGREANALL